jgi:hypothetical protein
MIEAIAEHELIFAGGLVLTLAYVALGYYLGRDALGPDANWWGPLRRTVVPKLDRFLADKGMYAENSADEDEFVGTAARDPEGVEAALYEQGYLWNFAAGLKTGPNGRTEYSSWARRQVQRPRLRALLDGLERIPALGVPIEILESILAYRQVHVTLFDGDGVTHVFAHEEPNAINPMVYVAHYRGGKSLLGKEVAFQRDDVGIREAARDLQEAKVLVEFSDVALEAGVDPVDIQASGGADE